MLLFYESETYENLQEFIKYFITLNKIQLDIMRRSHQENTQVHECIFEAIIAHTNAAVKFSCKMLIAWKNMTNKTFCKTLNDNVTLQNGIATFNQTLSFQTYLLYDKSTGSYLRKDTSLCLLLISMRKPDEEKLVGRIVVDLAQVLNESAYNKLEDHKLAFCSIPNASLTFRIQCASNNKTQIKPMDLDMDEFSIIARSLNQSGSSNNDQLIHLKNIVSKDMSSQEGDKNKQEAQYKVVAVQDPILQRVNLRENEQRIEQRNEKRLNLEDEKPKQDIYVRQHRQIPIQDPNSQNTGLEIGKQQQQNQGNADEAIQQPRIIDEIDNNEYQDKKDEYTKTEDQNKRETPYSLNSTELDKRTYYIQANSNSHQPHSNPKKDQQIGELQFQKKKFQNQNKKLEQLLEQAHNNLLYQREETNKWRKLFEGSEQKIFRLEAEKDAVIQQLLQQAQESSRLCIELNSKLQQFQNANLNGQKLKRKLKQAEEANEQSERLRLDIQSQLLQIRFELAQLKAENEDKSRQLQHKQQQIQQMQRQIQELKSSGAKHEEGEKSLYKSYSIMSQKERQNYNQQIQALQRKVNRLTSDLQFTQNVKQNLSHLSHACEELSIQKQTLLIELSNLRAERERVLREKKDLQLNQELKERQDTEDMNKKLEVVQLELKEVQNEMGRYEDEKEGLQRNIFQLQKNLENANEQNTFLKSLIMEKQGELANNRNQNVEKLQKLSRQKDQFINQLQQQITNLKDSLKSSQQNQNKTATSNKNLEAKIEKLKSQLQFIQFANAEANKQLEQHKLRLKQKSDQLLSTEQRLSNLSNQMTKLETQLSQHNQSIQKSFQNSQTQLIQYKNIIDNLENEKQKNQTNLKQQKQSIDKLYNQIQYLTNNIRDLQTKNKQLQVVGQLQAQASTHAPTTIDVQRGQIEKHLANEKISSLERLIDDKSAIIELKERQIEEMGQNAELDATKIIELEERISRFAEKQAKMRENILILEEESRKIFDIVVEKQQNQQLQAQLIEEKDVQIDKLRGIINDKALQLQLTHEQLAEYKKQLTQISHGQQGTNNNLPHIKTADSQPGIHEYQQQLQTLQALKAELQISRKKEKEEIQRKQGLISKLEQQVNEKNQMLTQETKKSTKKINEMKFKVQEYQAKNQELSKQNNFLLENKLVSQNQIKVLLNEKRVCLADIDRLKHRIKQLLNENSQLQSKIIPSLNVQAGSQPQNLNQGYKLQLQVEKSKVTELTDHLQVLQESLQKYEESIEKEKSNAMEKQQKLKQNQLLMQQVQSKLEESQTWAHDLKLKYQQAEFRSTQHQYQINDYETEIQRMRGQLDQASSQIQYFHHLSQQYEQKLKKLQENKSHLPTTIQTAQPNSSNEMINLKQQIVLLEAQVSSQDNQLKQLKEELANANQNVASLKSQIQDREVQKMNSQLQKQFQSIKGKIKEEFGKGDVQNMSNNNYQDIIEACRCLQQLIKQRSEKDKTESIIELMVRKNAILEEQLNKITEQRGIVQQSARKLSMQFQKIKAKILKGKGSHQQKNELLSSLKPAESKVKDLVQLTEKIFDSQLDSETY